MRLPDHPNLDHLKKQAKDLLRLARAADPAVLARFTAAMPYAGAPEQLRLHDAQSCVAREYGFRSWQHLATEVAARCFARLDRSTRRRRWLALAYGGDVTGTYNLARPELAARVLHDDPGLADDASAACAAGDVAGLRRAIADDPGWVHRPGGPFNLPPLVAVTHSRLAHVPALRDRMIEAARCLLQAGADPNQSIGNRFPPASLDHPDESGPLSALYGAAGVNRDLALTALLLEAGADPNDGESLYHSLENPACTRLLLAHGARIAGTNALPRALDMAEPAALELLLAQGADPNEASRGPLAQVWGAPLLRAIALRQPNHAAVLIAAGADPHAGTPGGVSAYRLAMQVGLEDVAALLRRAGAAEELSVEDRFVAACGRADGAEAARLRALRPDLPSSLHPAQLRLMPDAVAWGSTAAARVMVGLGWPIAAQGGDWQASALNLAVMRGDAKLARFLLGHGARWEERHGYGDDVLGTLSWASINQPGPAGGDWAGCARALLAHGLAPGVRDPVDAAALVIGGKRRWFSDDVTEALAEAAPG